jgi:hypothetical protein
METRSGRGLPGENCAASATHTGIHRRSAEGANRALTHAPRQRLGQNGQARVPVDEQGRGLASASIEKEMMMALKRLALFTTLFFASFGCTQALAAAAGDGWMQEQQQGSVSFITGGVGDDESDQMKQISKNYPLQLLLVAKGARNPYLSYVDVKIQDKSGKTVLETNGGPFLLAKLPPGSYTVTATAEGGTKKQTVQVGKTPQRVLMVWPAVSDKVSANPS